MDKYIQALLRELKTKINADVAAIKAELKRLGYDGPEVSDSSKSAKSANQPPADQTPETTE